MEMTESGSHSDIAELKERLVAAGCFRPAPLAYGLRIAVVTSTIAVGYAGLLVTPDWGVRLICIAVIAIASVQAAFIAHDVGDGAVTGSRTAARLLRQGLMSLLAGTSSTYFLFLHRLHHVTVDRGRLPMGGGDYAVNPYEIGWLKRLVAWNGLLFFTVTVCLRALTFRLESLRFLARNPRACRIDIPLIALHYLIWLGVPAALLGGGNAMLNYALITLAAGPYIGLVLVLNHEGMSRAHELTGRPMLERVLQTTRNLGRSWWQDLAFGGVNNHIEHHLFPEIPAVRLSVARAITCAFCRERGYAYVETGFLGALQSAASHFSEQSRDRLAMEALS